MKITPHALMRAGLLLLLFGLWPLIAPVFQIFTPSPVSVEIPPTRRYEQETFLPRSLMALSVLRTGRRIKMSIPKIAIGASGEAQFKYKGGGGAAGTCGPIDPFEWAIFKQTAGGFGGDSCTPNGWSASSSGGGLSVSNTATPGLYWLYNNVTNTSGPGGGPDDDFPYDADFDVYEFEVVCMTGEGCYEIQSIDENTVVVECSITLEGAGATPPCFFTWGAPGGTIQSVGETTAVISYPRATWDTYGCTAYVDITCGSAPNTCDLRVYVTEECTPQSSGSSVSASESGSQSDSNQSNDSGNSGNSGNSGGNGGGGGGGGSDPNSLFSSSGGSLPTSWDASSSGLGTSLPSSGTSTGGAPTSSGFASSGEGTSAAPSGTSTGGVATSGDFSSDANSLPQSGTSAGGIATSYDITSSGLGTSQGLSGTSSDAECPPDWCPPGYIWDAQQNKCVPGVADIRIPFKPAPPRIVADCKPPIKVKSPLWPNPQSNVRPWQKVRLYKGDVTALEQHIAEWTAENGEYSDVAVEILKSYSYRVRVGNEAGWSELSDAANIALVSGTCTVNITEPQDGVTGLHRDVILQGTVIDAGGASDVRFEWDGRPLEDARLVWPGTNKNGAWRLIWDTRRAIQGTGKLRLLAKGSDECWASDEITLTLANTPANSVQYFDVGPLQIVEPSLLFRDVYIGVELPALSSATRDQYMALCGLRAWNIGESDPMATAPTTPAQAQTQFDAHQRVALVRKKTATANALRRERRVYSALPKLKSPKQIVVARFQLHERELFIPYKIGPSTHLRKAREAKDAGKVIVFGTPGAVMQFDGTSYTLLKDLADLGASDAVDAALIDDKIYFLRPGSRSVWVCDTTAGERHWTFQIRSSDGALEPRLPKIVERVGESLVVFCVDATLSPATKVYKVTGDDVAPLWDVTNAVSLSDVASTGVLAFAAGAQLWRSTAALAAPVLVNTFNADITALDQFRVGTQNGGVWAWNGAAWIQELTTQVGGNPAPVAAVGAWNGANEVLRGVAVASGSSQLYEQDGDGSWPGGRVVANPAGGPEVATQVLALRRYLKTAGNATPGQEPQIEDERLLILTGNDGLLLTLSISALGESNGAFPMSALGVAQLASGGSKEAKPIEASGTP